MTQIRKEMTIKVDLKTVSDAKLDALCEQIPSLRKRLPVVEFLTEAQFDLKQISDDELQDEVEAREIDTSDWLDRTYRYLAEGNIADAMDELHRKFGLAPPSHECAIADLLTLGRA